MNGKQFSASLLQSLMQEQTDRHAEYQRLDDAADIRITQIDKELIEIDRQLAGQAV